VQFYHPFCLQSILSTKIEEESLLSKLWALKDKENSVMEERDKVMAKAKERERERKRERNVKSRKAF
jgi:hypothetical protein